MGSPRTGRPERDVSGIGRRRHLRLLFTAFHLNSAYKYAAHEIGVRLLQSDNEAIERDQSRYRIGNRLINASDLPIAIDDSPDL